MEGDNSVSCRQLPSAAVSHRNHTYANRYFSDTGLHLDTATNRKPVRLFWSAFAVMFIYEIIPSYIFPQLNGFNIFCLASQHAAPRVQNVFTNIFGGANSNEGLGLFSLSFDWQYITSALVPSADDNPIRADDL
jgi:hypothetical protein